MGSSVASFLVLGGGGGKGASPPNAYLSSFDGSSLATSKKEGEL